MSLMADAFSDVVEKRKVKRWESKKTSYGLLNQWKKYSEIYSKNKSKHW